MNQLPKETYLILEQLFELVGLSDSEQEENIEAFERILLSRMVKAVMKKLSEDEGKKLAALANNSEGNKNKQEEVRKMLESSLNKSEVTNLYTKVSSQLFNEVLQEEYKEATDEQKTKLEKLFKMEKLKS